jgi:hypothetical protein
MRRRAFITLLGGAVVTSSNAARAQPRSTRQDEALADALIQ